MHIFNPSAFALGLFFPSADFDEHYSFNLGARNCFNSNAGAKHIYLPISDWLGGNVFSSRLL